MPTKHTAMKVPFGALLEGGMIKPGETLVSPKGKWRAKVRADGSLVHDNDGGIAISGSIHSLGAKLQGRESCNGWSFWQIERGKKTIPLDDLRDQIRQQMDQ